jgi:hypothetical protein
MKNSTKIIAKLMLIIFAFWFFRYHLADNPEINTQPLSPSTSLVVEDTDIEINDTKGKPWGSIILVIGLMGFAWRIGGIRCLFYMTVAIVCFIGCFYDVVWKDGSFPTFKDEFPEWSLLEKIGIGFIVGIAFIICWLYFVAESIRDFFKD